MKLLQLTRTLSDWSATIQADDGRIATLTYAAKPTQSQVFADVNAVFSPPTASVTAEDGTVLQLADAQALAITLTPTQKTRLAGDIADLQILVNQVANRLPSDPAARAQLRAHSPILDALLSAAERLA